MKLQNEMLLQSQIDLQRMIQTDISNKVNKNLIVNQEYKQFKTPKRKKESNVVGVNSGL